MVDGATVKRHDCQLARQKRDLARHIDSGHQGTRNEDSHLRSRISRKFNAVKVLIDVDDERVRIEYADVNA